MENDTLACQFLENIEINNDVTRTLDDLVNERLRYHLFMNHPNIGVQCLKVMFESANISATKINSLEPEQQVAFLLGYGYSESDLTDDLNNGVSNFQRARDFIERVNLTELDNEGLKLLVLNTCLDHALDDIDDGYDMYGIEYKPVNDGGEKEGIFAYLRAVAKQDAEIINLRGPQYQVARLLQDGFQEDNLQPRMKVEASRKHAKIEYDSLEPDNDSLKPDIDSLEPDM